MCPHPLLLLFIVTTRLPPFILFTMVSSMNGLNTSRSIVILFVIILSVVLSSWSQSPLKINLYISSRSHILMDTFVLGWQPWVGITSTLSFFFWGGGGGLLSCIKICGLWAHLVYLYSTLICIAHSCIFYYLRNTIQSFSISYNIYIYIYILIGKV